MKKSTWIYILLAVLACAGAVLAFIYRHAIRAAIWGEEENVAESQEQPCAQQEPSVEAEEPEAAA